MEWSKTDSYSYRTKWSEEDQEHVGLCAEFPLLSHLDPDQGKAMAGIIELVKEVVADLGEDEAPDPITGRDGG